MDGGFCLLSFSNSPRCLASSSSAFVAPPLSTITITTLPLSSTLGTMHFSSWLYSIAGTSCMHDVATLCSDVNTKSAVMSVRFERSAIFFCKCACMGGVARRICANLLAAFGEYPARIYACVALKSIKYSLTNAFCLPVRALSKYHNEPWGYVQPTKPCAPLTSWNCDLFCK